MPPEQNDHTAAGLFRDIWRTLQKLFDQPLATSFFLLALSTVGVVLIGLHLLDDDAPTNVAWIQRLTNQLIILAAITLIGSITLSFLAKEGTRAWVLGLGLLSIGALLLPTNDLIRIVLATVRTDIDFQSLYPTTHTTSHGRKEAVQDRAQALFVTITEARSGDDCRERAVRQLNYLHGENPIKNIDAEVLYRDIVRAQATEACASNTVEKIARFFTDEEEKEVMHIVQDRGLLDVLLALGSDNERPVLLLDNLSNEHFHADLQFLHAEGLIRFLYGDFDTIRLTQLGRRITNRAGGDLTPTSRDRATDSNVRASNELDVSQGFYTGEHYLGSGDNVYNFNVNAEGYYTLDVIGRDGVDPIVRLFQRTSGNGPGVLVDQNDDGGNGLNARLAVSLASDQHYLIVSEYNDAPGWVVINIRRDQ